MRFPWSGGATVGTGALVLDWPASGVEAPPVPSLLPDWPATLPPRPALEGRYEESPPDVLIRTEMDAGPPKVRRRYTAGIRPILCAVRLDTAQKHILDDFFVDDCESGAQRFTWVHPTTAAPAVYRFRRPPIFTVLDRDIWEAALELELLP